MTNEVFMTRKLIFLLLILAPLMVFASQRPDGAPSLPEPPAHIFIPIPVHSDIGIQENFGLQPNNRNVCNYKSTNYNGNEWTCYYSVLGAKQEIGEFMARNTLIATNQSHTLAFSQGCQPVGAAEKDPSGLETVHFECTARVTKIPSHSQLVVGSGQQPQVPTAAVQHSAQTICKAKTVFGTSEIISWDDSGAAKLTTETGQIFSGNVVRIAKDPDNKSWAKVDIYFKYPTPLYGSDAAEYLVFPGGGGGYRIIGVTYVLRDGIKYLNTSEGNYSARCLNN